MNEPLVLIVVIAALIAIALVAFSVARSNAELVRIIVSGRRRENETLTLLVDELKSREELVRNTMETSYQKQWALTDRAFVANLLREQGPGAIVASPEEYMNSLVIAVRDNLNVDEQAARRWVAENVVGVRSKAS